MSSLFASLPDSGTVRILSDLHLGHDMSVVKSAASLRPLIEGADHLIFNGDTLQERAPAFRARSREMLDELLNMCRQTGAATTFLRGNHDPTAWPLELVDLCHGQVAITHGDIFFPLISPWSVHLREFRPILEAIHAEYPPSTLLDPATRYAMIQRCRLALPPSETRQRSHRPIDLAAFFCREIWPPRRPWEILKSWMQLPQLATAFADQFLPSCRVLLFGHTHRPGVWRRSQRLLINTGAFVTFAKPLLVEIKNQQLSVHPLAERRGHWQKQSLIASEFLSPKPNS